MENKNYFKELMQIDVKEHIKKKGLFILFKTGWIWDNVISLTVTLTFTKHPASVLIKGCPNSLYSFTSQVAVGYFSRNFVTAHAHDK